MNELLILIPILLASGAVAGLLAGLLGVGGGNSYCSHALSHI